ncbi:hypothetical protein JCM10207_001351 [Rhodosporidiobolus poonsookiae]
MSDSTPTPLEQPAQPSPAVPDPTLLSVRATSLASSHPTHPGFSFLHTLSHPSTWRATFYHYSKRNLFLAVVQWWIACIVDVLALLAVAPTSVLLDPLSVVFGLALYLVLGLGLTIWAVVLTLWRLLGGASLTNAIGEKWGDGRSIPNWPNPRIFGDAARTTLEAARPFFGGQIPTTIEHDLALDELNPSFSAFATRAFLPASSRISLTTLSYSTRVFSVVAARSLLILSSLMYERSDELVEEAVDTAFAAKQALDAGDIDDAESRRRMVEAETLLENSEQPIRDKAAEWSLSYDGVADLTVIGGPSASLLYTPPGSPDPPFIILVFKGTGVTNFSELVVDLSISRAQASTVFGAGAGGSHKGFFTSLFKSDTHSAGGDGYGSVIMAIKHVAARVNAARGPGWNGPIPL